MEVHFRGRLAVNGAFRFGKDGEGPGCQSLALLAHAACGDDGQNVGKRAVFVLMGQIDLCVHTADMVHFPAYEVHGAFQFGA